MNDDYMPSSMPPLEDIEQPPQKQSMKTARQSPSRHEPSTSHKKIAQKQAMKKRKKNENILCAIVALMKELDRSGLEYVKLDADKRIGKILGAANASTEYTT